MISSSVFSGKFSTTVNGAPTKNFSYDGSLSTKNKKLTFDIATDIDGAKDRLALKNISPQALATNPKFMDFMNKMQASSKFRKSKSKKSKRKTVKRKTKRS